MNITRKRALQGVGLAAVMVPSFAVNGCASNSNWGDLKGVTYHDPDKIEGYRNVDGQPNITRLCIDHVAFMTTSRDYTSVMRVPEWDAWCGAAAK